MTTRGVTNKVDVLYERNESNTLLWALLTPAPLPLVSNCAEYKKVYISTFIENIRHKMS